jgi:hypothetical protein
VSLSLYDFRALDLLLRLSEDGGMSSLQIGEAFGADARAAGSRFAWMRRYGMVDLDAETGSWSVSAAGRRVIQSKLRASQIAVVEKLPDESLVETMAQITSRYIRGEPMLAHMMRREFMYGTRRRG